MSQHAFVRAGVISALAALFCLGCGAGTSSVGGGNNGVKDAGTEDAGVDAGSGPKTCDPGWLEICNGVDDNCDGTIDEGYDKDGDGVSQCATLPDCDDDNPAVHPGATEVGDGNGAGNGIDEDCDGKVDFGVAGVDYDGDGSPYPADCNDDNVLVGPNAVEVGGDNTDNDCDGQIDNVIDCESAGTSGNTALDFAHAMGICGSSVQAQFVHGSTQARKIRAKFGDNFTAQDGAKLIQLSSGKAVDNYDDSSYLPEEGTDFSSGSQTIPQWSASDCFPQSSAPAAHDLTELKITMKVPSNAKSLSYNVNFFSAEYPDFVCTRYNDRFIALLKSSALEPTKLPGGANRNCVPGSGTPECNVSFDSHGQPLTINSGFFDICRSDPPEVSYTCSKPPSLLAKTGYDQTTSSEYAMSPTSGPLGGATGWLTTKAPVTPGETITLRFVILDEGDGIYDSSVLIDGFKWELQTVDSPSTVPIN